MSASIRLLMMMEKYIPTDTAIIVCSYTDYKMNMKDIEDYRIEGQIDQVFMQFKQQCKPLKKRLRWHKQKASKRNFKLHSKIKRLIKIIELAESNNRHY